MNLIRAVLNVNPVLKGKLKSHFPKNSHRVVYNLWKCLLCNETSLQLLKNSRITNYSCTSVWYQNSHQQVSWFQNSLFFFFFPMRKRLSYSISACSFSLGSQEPVTNSNNFQFPFPWAYVGTLNTLQKSKKENNFSY